MAIRASACHRRRASRAASPPPAPSAPASLAASDPDSFHAIVLGAPELLTKAEADMLRAFVRVRGGLLIVAPDRMLDASSPVLDLLPARKFTERLLNEPAALTPMFASEFAIPDALLPGAETLLRLGAARHGSAPRRALRPHRAQTSREQPASGSPVIVGSPLGDGYAIVSGALDAWRYRDRAKDGFDRFWRDTISARARDRARARRDHARPRGRRARCAHQPAGASALQQRGQHDDHSDDAPPRPRPRPPSPLASTSRPMPANPASPAARTPPARRFGSGQTHGRPHIMAP